MKITTSEYLELITVHISCFSLFFFYFDKMHLVMLDQRFSYLFGVEREEMYLSSLNYMLLYH